MSEAVATLIARAALAGFTMRQAEHGRFVAERWGHIVVLMDQAAAEKWLAMVTGKRAA